MADSDPTTFFRPKWHQAYWQRHRLFQNGVATASAYTGFKRRHTLDRFALPADLHRSRRFAPTVFVDPYTGSITLLWGV